MGNLDAGEEKGLRLQAKGQLDSDQPNNWK
jgi:hypothetical protein